MKTLLVIFGIIFTFGIFATASKPKKFDKIDELDELLKKVSLNLETAGEVTKMAQSMNEELVANKVEEKKELKNEIAMSQAKIGKYIKTMMIFDIDTGLVNIEEDTLHMNNMMKLNGLR